MLQFDPINELEAALQKARSGSLPMSDFIKLFVSSELAVPSGEEVMADGSGFRPLLFDKGQVKMVACFTAKERIGAFAARAPYCLVIKGRDFLRRVPPNYGLVINPGHSIGFEISPEGLLNIVRDFA